MENCREYRCDQEAEHTVYAGRREYRVCPPHRAAVAAGEAVTLRSDTPGFITGFGCNVLSVTRQRRAAAKEGVAAEPRVAKPTASGPIAGSIAPGARDAQALQIAFAL